MGLPFMSNVACGAAQLCFVVCYTTNKTTDSTDICMPVQPQYESTSSPMHPAAAVPWRATLSAAPPSTHLTARPRRQTAATPRAAQSRARWPLCRRLTPLGCWHRCPPPSGTCSAETNSSQSGRRSQSKAAAGEQAPVTPALAGFELCCASSCQPMHPHTIHTAHGPARTWQWTPSSAGPQHAAGPPAPAALCLAPAVPPAQPAPGRSSGIQGKAQRSRTAPVRRRPRSSCAQPGQGG